MSKRTPLEIKAEKIAISCISECKIIQKRYKEYDVTRQLIRSSGSVFANVNEAVVAESRKDFVHKLGISRKELSESLGWILILYKLNYIDITKYEKLRGSLSEGYKILNSAISTAKKGLRR